MAYFILRKKKELNSLRAVVERKLKIIFPAGCLMNAEIYSQSSELRVGKKYRHREGKEENWMWLDIELKHHNSGSLCPGHSRLYRNISGKARRSLSTLRQMFLCLCILRKKHWQQSRIFNDTIRIT